MPPVIFIKPAYRDFVTWRKTFLKGYDKVLGFEKKWGSRNGFAVAGRCGLWGVQCFI